MEWRRADIFHSVVTVTYGTFGLCASAKGEALNRQRYTIDMKAQPRRGQDCAAYVAGESAGSMTGRTAIQQRRSAYRYASAHPSDAAQKGVSAFIAEVGQAKRRLDHVAPCRNAPCTSPARALAP